MYYRDLETIPGEKEIKDSLLKKQAAERLAKNAAYNKLNKKKKD